MNTRFFDSELDTLRDMLVRMGEHAIQQLRLSIRALLEQDVFLAKRVCQMDKELNQMEVELDAEAVRYMTLRGPVARDLRLVVVGMKASHDLERVGDEATNIARRAITLAEKPPLKEYIDIPRMSEMAISMLQDSIECFLQGDQEKAVAICKRDKEVDQLDGQLYRELSGYIAENPQTISVAIELMFISRSLERAADHATNIAEEVIFLFSGEIVRHSSELKA